MSYASCWQRLAAYLLDVIPIVLIIAGLFYTCFGFDETLRRYFEKGPRDIEARSAFLHQRNTIRGLSLVAYLLYAAVMHASPLQGTFGKRLFAIRVVDWQGQRISFGRSMTRAFAILASVLPIFIGCLAAFWSPKKQAWHDRIAGTFVINDPLE